MGIRRPTAAALSALGLLAGSVAAVALGSAAAAASGDNGGSATAATAQVSSFAATVTVGRDGALTVEEELRLSSGGSGALPTLTQSLVTREQYDADHDRVYDISDVTASVDGSDAQVSVSSSADADVISVDPGGGETATVRLTYVARGAVAQTADGLEVRWPVVQGLDWPVARARVDWNAPGALWLSCLAGSPGSSRPCTTSQLVDSPTPTMTQQGLDTGDEMVGILGLPADAGIAPSVELKERWSLARSFTASGSPLGLALATLALGLLAAFALWWTRGRDADDGAPVSSDPLVDIGDGRVSIAPPGAVRPGQMGTLVDEHADVVDVSATVLDLATRNYLFVEEVPRGAYGRMDWRLQRRNEAGDELLGYEREILEAVFAAGDQVLVSELPARLWPRLAAIQGLMYDDMVDQGWFAERPDAVRSRWTTAGWVLVAAGVVLTLVLAAATTYGLVGLAVVLGGVALAGSGQLAPARTTKGAQLLRQLQEFRGWLARAGADELPDGQREELASRLYAYAVVFGLGERWADALAGLDDDPDPDEPLYWYGAPSDWHLSDAGPSLQHLVVSLNAAIGSRRLLDAP